MIQCDGDQDSSMRLCALLPASPALIGRRANILVFILAVTLPPVAQEKEWEKFFSIYLYIILDIYF